MIHMEDDAKHIRPQRISHPQYEKNIIKSSQLRCDDSPLVNELQFMLASYMTFIGGVRHTSKADYKKQLL